MYSNNIMPQYRMNMSRSRFGIPRNNGDRLFGGFAVPFLLGGITGGLLARPGGFGGYGYAYPYPYPYPVPTPYMASGYPTFSENYYYY